MPFTAKDQDSLWKKINAGVFDMPKSFSPELKDLIERMITVEPKNRITAQEIIHHAWTVKYATNCNDCEEHAEEHTKLIINNLK